MEKRRTILIYLASLVLLIGSLSFSVSAQTISVDPGSIERDPGDSFTIDIKVDPEGTEISGAQYVLFFDSKILNATSQTQGTFLSGNTLPGKIDNLNGTVKYGEYKIGGSGVTNPGVLASVTFDVIGTSGTSYLKFTDVILSDPDGQKIQGVTINHGSFSIAQPSTPFLIRGSVSYKNGSDCNDPTVNITNLNTSKEWPAETNETSNYYQIVLSSGANITAGNTLQFNAISPDKSQWKVTEHTITQTEVGAGGFEYNIALEYRPGDVNGDGKITSADAVIALQMAVCGGYDRVADVNDDKSVTSLDALMIMQAAAEHITFGG
jgi:hypothetical protein